MGEGKRVESMIEMQQRYWDGLAESYQCEMRIATDDFHYGPQIPGEAELKLLPVRIPGANALEIGCGAAQNSIWLAKQGWECTAVDLSDNQLAHARRLARQAGVRIRFLRFPMEHLARRITAQFDLIHSSHALEFTLQPEQCVKEMAARLKPGGTLAISTVHPLYNGEWVREVDGGYESGDSGIFLRNYFAPPDDIRWKRKRVDVISRAYPVSAWFNWMRDAGLNVVQLREPPAVPDHVTPPYTNHDWARHEGELHAIPGTLIVVGKLLRSSSE